ncbi:hypothetical protein [Sphingomonas desiccabilis]|uniref:Uncharacterized protein n=1 Tax=Sphingomonas desiccabilis TaxID=429134 RepID=A0A4Q2IZJ6_9SPHN|nr:hypothetical protein [Sphingomonas desiccabilis]MBB3909750.1 hypothetical protein [Sphingomonas desiccabilis]RXZ34442.1 hypothetical protein EO081_01750 [Sphingomonas desiccabilis]
MNVVLKNNLNRGAVLVDYAYSRSGEGMELILPDYIGIVAAYLEKGRYSENIEQELGERLGPEIGSRAKRAFSMFEGVGNYSLWAQGAASDDIRFNNWKLSNRFPNLNRKYDAFERKF